MNCHGGLVDNNKTGPREKIDPRIELHFRLQKKRYGFLCLRSRGMLLYMYINKFIRRHFGNYKILRLLSLTILAIALTESRVSFKVATFWNFTVYNSSLKVDDGDISRRWECNRIAQLHERFMALN